MVTTDFFDREARAQKQTRHLIWWFGGTMLFVLLVNNLVLDSIVFMFHPGSYEGVPSVRGPLNVVVNGLYLFGEAIEYPRHFFQLILRPWVVFWVSAGTLLSIAGGCYYKIRELSEGGAVIAEWLGGRRVEPGTQDADEQRLRNVVGEMAVASGTSVPEIYVLDNERGINAFAAGFTRDDIALGVTRGALKLLTRDELQGIVAHEFSHILNGDTRLNTRLIGLAHGFFWPTLVGRVLTYGTTDEVREESFLLAKEAETKMLPTAPLGIIFMVLGSFSLPFVRLIKSAICRQREWLADAAAVQFTRHPEGIGGALKKIGGLFKRGRLDSPHAEVASHLYFTDCNYEPWFRFFGTHPPLAERIRAIDATFDGTFPKVTMLAPSQAERDQAFDQALSIDMALNRTLPEEVRGIADAATAARLWQAKLMRLGLPAEITTALKNPAGAASVVFSLLLDAEEEIGARQMEILRTRLAPEAFTQLNVLAPLVMSQGERCKFILAEFAVPALREYNRSEHDDFHQTMQELIECDGAVDLFEYMLMKMVARQLRSRFNDLTAGRSRYGRVQDLLPECSLLLSALAHLGQEDEATARGAFAKGVEFLDAPKAQVEAQVPFLTRSEWDLAKVDAALTKLAAYPESLKRNVLIACSKTVVLNGNVNERDAELLRAIADTFDCPLPAHVESALMEALTKESETLNR